MEGRGRVRGCPATQPPMGGLQETGALVAARISQGMSCPYKGSSDRDMGDCNLLRLCPWLPLHSSARDLVTAGMSLGRLMAQPKERGVRTLRAVIP